MDNSPYEKSHDEKVQIYNCMCRNKDVNLIDALKWAINLYRPKETENIASMDTDEDKFKAITRTHRKNN